MRRILCLILSLSMLVGWSTPDSTIKMGPSSTGDRLIIAEQGAGAANPKIKYDSSSSGWQFSNDGTSFKNFGSGSGQSNAFLFNDFEDNSVENWATYADAAAATPVDGTSGTATTLTVTASSSSPLNGTFSMSLAKSAANGQGQGVAAEFAIPSGYQQGAKRSLEFLWDGSDANYVAGDMRVYIYDVTNATLITPQPYAELPAAKTPIQLSWDASTSDSYRLVFHVATTNANAYGVKIDDVIVGAGEVIPMPAVGVFEAYTPTGSWTTNTTYSGQKKRETDVMRYHVRAVLSGQPDNLDFSLNFETNETPDFTKTGNIGGVDRVQVGEGVIRYSSVNYPVILVLAGSSPTAVSVQYQNSAPPLVSSNVAQSVPVAWGSGAVAELWFSYPVQQLADSPNYVASASQAVVQSTLSTTANQTFSSASGLNLITAASTNPINVGGGTWASNVYTVPETGIYNVSMDASMRTVTIAANILTNCALRINGSTTFYYGEIVSSVANQNLPLSGCSGKLRLNKGDTIQPAIYFGNTTTATLMSSNNSGLVLFSIERTTDEYGNPVVGFGYATPDSYGLVKLASGATASQARVENVTMGSISTTFTSNGTGGGTSSSVTIRIKRVGDWVTINVPFFSASAGTGSPTTFTANTALPSWARPQSNQSLIGGLPTNNGTIDYTVGRFNISTTGVIGFNRALGELGFTVSANAGLSTTTPLTYYVGP
jgi:hypothetical protein